MRLAAISDLKSRRDLGGATIALCTTMAAIYLAQAPQAQAKAFCTSLAQVHEGSPGSKVVFIGRVAKVSGGPDRGAGKVGLLAFRGRFWLKSTEAVKGGPVSGHGPFEYDELDLDDGQVWGETPKVGDRYEGFQSNEGHWSAAKICSDGEGG